jgi:hypothetical protein
VCAATFIFTARAADEGFVPLFDDKTLDGWEQHSGKAEYRVEDGAVVGKTVAGTDAMTKEGVIALQIHGIGKNVEQVGSEVRWRNLRIKELK